MRRVKFTILVFALLLALAPQAALAADTRGGETVTIRPDEIVDDDLYAFGGSVNVQGTVRGDVVAFAGNVTISGMVTGDVIAGGGTTTISGQVGGNVRAAGGTLMMSGPVGGDVLVAGGNFNLGPGATVRRDVLAATGSTLLEGPIGRNVTVNAGELTLGGPVGGNVRAESDNVRVTSSAVISGNLNYTSRQEASIAPGATIRGTIERQAPREEREEESAVEEVGEAIAGWIRAVIGLFFLGLIFILLFPRFSRDAISTVGRSPWASLGIGFALLVIVPIAAFVVFVVGIFVGGWYLGLFALAIYAMALTLGIVVTGTFVGAWVLMRSGRIGLHFVWPLLAGLVILTLVGLVPIAGGIVVFVAILIGLGALTLAAYRRRTSEDTTELRGL